MKMNKITGFLLTTGFRKFRHMLRNKAAKSGEKVNTATLP